MGQRRARPETAITQHLPRRKPATWWIIALLVAACSTPDNTPDPGSASRNTGIFAEEGSAPSVPAPPPTEAADSDEATETQSEPAGELEGGMNDEPRVLALTGATEGGTPVLIVSEDGGESWINRSVSVTPLGRLSALAADGRGNWMTVGHVRNQYASSSDGGFQWEERGEHPVTGRFGVGSLAHIEAGSWVTAGAGGQFAVTHDDGWTWHSVDVPIEAPYDLIVDHHGQVVAGGSGSTPGADAPSPRLAVSRDAGERWQDLSDTFAYTERASILSLALDGDQWMAVGYRVEGNVPNETRHPLVATRGKDDATWASHSTGFPLRGGGVRLIVTDGHGTWMAAGRSQDQRQGVAVSNDNGVTWEERSETLPAIEIVDIVHMQGSWYLLGNRPAQTAVLMRSDDEGRSWTEITGEFLQAPFAFYDALVATCAACP